MRVSSFRALMKTLESAHLLEVVREALSVSARASGTVVVRQAQDGTLHAKYCQKAVDLPKVEMLHRDVLDGSVTCPSCVTDLARSVLSLDERELVEAYMDARATQTSAARGKIGAGTPAKRSKALAAHLVKIGRVQPVQYADAVTFISAELVRAQDALGSAMRDKSLAEALLARVRKELCKRVGSANQLDNTEVLIGLTRPVLGSGTAADVLLTLAYPEASAHQVLVGPRYVVHYLYRELFRTHEETLIVDVPLAGVDPQIVRTAVQLWQPRGQGPLANLTTAFETARASLAV